ncbi:hypothetical protein A7J71_18560 [Achromobacter insolitus]|uniref:hypothetical protein n=1 Tax=Achromobacter insolitus TaxID=217204 RepID=UPI0007C83DDD|nr:hypothetical protein [Achromobacter insolitus]OAE51561.1 hypothetical protein A7J71_18560 [Achromobacter insolitus]OCZ50364.1 hypothetical protein A7P22_30655 [Achromobacter insolitus]
MPDSNWICGSEPPDRQGFFETEFNTGQTEITMYSILGWMPPVHRGYVVRWRLLEPAVEQAEIERYLYYRREGGRGHS